MAGLGSLPTCAALANEISVKTEDERRHCGLSDILIEISQPVQQKQ